MATEKMTQAEYARHRGLSRAAIARLVKRGDVVLDGHGAVDVHASDKALDGRPANYRGGKTTKDPVAPADGTLASAVARKESALARLRELELAEREGRLCETAALMHDIEGMATLVRNNLLALPSRLAPRLAMKPAAVVKTRLDDAIREVLEGLANTEVIFKKKRKA